MRLKFGHRAAINGACRKSDPAKLAIAEWLRRETTLTLKASAARVHLGTSKSANARLHAWMKSPRPATAGRRKARKR